MNKFRTFSALAAALVFGGTAMVAQTLLLRRFLWRFESAETGVALFLSCWLFWSAAGAATLCAPFGRRAAEFLSRAVWPLMALCAGLYFAEYALIVNLRAWLGVPDYQAFPLMQLALGCFVANAPFSLVGGLIVPVICRRLSDLGVSVSRAFAWEALGAALGGLGVTLLLFHGVSPDPRDEAEWHRYFPQAVERPQRFETGGGTTFYGSHGGSFYALSSGGVSEILPEGDRAVELAALVLSQRPYAKDVLLLGRVPLAVALALEALRPDVSVVWCPCDAQYGALLLSSICAQGLDTRVTAAGETPRRLLARLPDAAFDCVVAAPPSAATLEGAAWQQSDFALAVRRVTRRTGVALFGLDSGGGANLTPEAGARLEAYVGAIRQTWPESGVFAVGAGGWWIASQVPKLAYGAESAATRFALLKQSLYPAAALPPLYDPEGGRRLAESCPALSPEVPVLLPESVEVGELLALGWADMLRRSYPTVAPGLWLERLKTGGLVRVLELLLVVLWMVPVAFGSRDGAPRRLLAAWLAACGALGLAATLAVLYRLQMRFGALYLLAGAGSCLYLAGLFCGNRLGEGLAQRICRWPAAVRGLLVTATAVQVAVGLGILSAAGVAPSAVCLVTLCFAAGCAAGLAVPAALAVGDGAPSESAAAFVLADALGAAAGGLFFAVAVPLLGLHESVVCFAMLALGIALCAAVSGTSARLAAGLALVVALSVLGGRLRDAWPQSGAPSEASESASLAAEAPQAGRNATNVVGVSRKVDTAAIEKQMRAGTLSTNAACFWRPD